MSIKLRPYQVQAIEELDAEFSKGNRKGILYCATGSGKTTMASWMIQRAIKYDYPVIFVVRGRLLVQNISETLNKYNIDHSVCMSGHWKFDQSKLVQICSIDTLKARAYWPHKEKEPLIFLDESHFSYSSIFENYPNAFIIGMSGSPFTDNSMYNFVVKPIDAYEIRDQGYLVPEKIYCPHVIDVSAVKMVAGDFERKQLETVVSDSKIVGNIVTDWMHLGQNRPTLCYAVSVEHSLRLKQEFNDRGIPALHVDASSTQQERDNAKSGLISGKVKVVCNVNLLTTGWDCPAVSCIIHARPTWSLVWHLQTLGRGLRASPGKENCIVIDNAGNVFRHSLPYRIREVSLEKPVARKSKKMENKICTCENCFYIFDPEEYDKCPECGWIKPKAVREINQVDGELVEYMENEEERQARLFEMMRKDYYKLEWVRKTKKLKEDWVFIQLKKKYPSVYHMLGKVTLVPNNYTTNIIF